jgi:hypothetical protein
MAKRQTARPNPFQRWRSRRRFIREANAYHEKRDPKENAESRPPGEEQVELHSIWVAEIYTPSLVGRLREGLHGLGWDKGGESMAIEHLNVAQWVAESRSSSLGGGWVNLGGLARPGDTSYFGVRRTPLPDGVAYGSATMHSPVPSLTVCVLEFVLDETRRRGIQDVLESEFRSKMPRLDGGTQIHSPKNLKQDALKASRTAARDSCAQWFRDHLPGAFAGGLAGGLFPTLELLITTSAEPFRMEGPDNPWYMWALNLESATDAWINPSIPELVLQMPHISFDDRTALVLTGKKPDIFSNRSEQFEGYGDGDRALTHWLSHRIEGNLVMWAIYQLLLGNKEDLGELRDAVRSKTESSKQATKRLEDIRSALLATSADAEIAATEIRTVYELEHWHPWNATDFEPLWEYRKERQDSWIEALRSSTLMLAKNLLTSQRQVRDTLAAEGSLVGGITNLKVQRTLVWLTVFIAILTCLAVGIAAAQWWEIISKSG